jgi:hypothetical protein
MLGAAQINAFDRARTEGELHNVATVRQSIASWLLHYAQLRSGANQGGVAGTIDADGSALYVYPEIAGYFLQWLAWLRTQGHGAARLTWRAAACQRWLATWIERTDPPQTRVHLRADVRDWRNSGTFFFDLAMVLRGLASTVEIELVCVDQHLVERLVEQLTALIAPDGMFLACAATSPGAPLPARWSTRRGGFLSKAAAGILSAARVLPQITPELRSAAQTTLAASISLALEQPHEEVHPRIYAIEGALAASAQGLAAPALPLLTQQIDEVLERALPDGLPCESLRLRVPRVDAGAQCLRAAYLLRAQDYLCTPDIDAMRAMLLTVLHCTRPDGSLPFNVGDGCAIRCVWAAMFAEQALTLACLPPSESLLRDASRWIV